MNVVGPIITDAAAGGAGVATGSATWTVRVCGRVTAVYVDYQDSPPATTDLTVSTVGTFPDPPSVTLLTLTDTNTDGWYYPRQQIHDSAGAGVTYDGTNEVYEPVPIYDFLKVTMAQADNGDYARVWVLVE